MKLSIAANKLLSFNSTEGNIKRSQANISNIFQGACAMSKLIIIAKVVSKKEAVQSVQSELLKLIAPTRKEDGCLDYTLHQDNDNAAVFMFYETWESMAHLEKHMNSDHFKAYVKATDGLIEAKAVNKLSRIE
jgi:quinol monooxygenase YgiN